MRSSIYWVLPWCVACSDPSSEPPDGRQPVAEFSAADRKLDLLFVIDDSGSMADKQANLAANFPSLVARLNALPGGLPDLHLGVVSTDMGTSNSGGPPSPPIGQPGLGGCSGTGDAGELSIGAAPVTGNFVSDTRNPDGTRTRNYTGTLDEVFGQMARLGATGCGFEQPLRAMRAALDDNPANAGFLRSDALLAVVFLTDEDDCSVKDGSLFSPESPTLGPLLSFRCARFGVRCASGGATSDAMNVPGVKDQCTATGDGLLDDVASYHAFLTGLKANPDDVVVGAIMGDPTPVVVELRTTPGGTTSQPALAASCSFAGTTGPEVADPAVRMQDFLARFDDRASSSTICQSDLTTPLDGIGQAIARSVGSSCIEVALADVDPDVAGAQVDCVVEDVVAGVATPIAPCGPTPEAPCWRLETDTLRCPAADHLKLVVDRATPPAPATRTRMRCRVD